MASRIVPGRQGGAQQPEGPNLELYSPQMTEEAPRTEQIKRDLQRGKATPADEKVSREAAMVALNAVASRGMDEMRAGFMDALRTAARNGHVDAIARAMTTQEPGHQYEYLTETGRNIKERYAGARQAQDIRALIDEATSIGMNPKVRQLLQQR
jgi:hypothetical protein